MFDVPLLVQVDDRAAFDQGPSDRLNPVTGAITSRVAAATTRDAGAIHDFTELRWIKISGARGNDPI